jgi:DNA-directed RNA polymerase subunit L
MNQDIEFSDEKLVVSKKIDTAATYSFNGEDHTLGNLVRSLLIHE